MRFNDSLDWGGGSSGDGETYSNSDGESTKKNGLGGKSRICFRCPDFETLVRELSRLQLCQQTEPTLGIPNRGMAMQAAGLPGSQTRFAQAPTDQQGEELRLYWGKTLSPETRGCRIEQQPLPQTLPRPGEENHTPCGSPWLQPSGLPPGPPQSQMQPDAG